MADAAEISAWSVEVGLSGDAPAGLVAGYCERLVEAGVPLWRAAIGADRLHPLIGAQGQNWVAGDGVHEEVYLRATGTAEQEADWRQSPWFRLLEDNEAAHAPPALGGRRDQRVPAARQPGGQGRNGLFRDASSASESAPASERRAGLRHPGRRAGRRDSTRATSLLSRRRSPPFTLALKATESIDTARTLMTTYLGREPSARVLRGQIERGKVNNERKVLWFSDLSGFTRIADTAAARDQLLGCSTTMPTAWSASIARDMAARC